MMVRGVDNGVYDRLPRLGIGSLALNVRTDIQPATLDGDPS
jgi:hypothetical protein